MKIIVTGCNGQLGNAVIELLKNGKGSLREIPACYDEFELFPGDVDELDIRAMRQRLTFLLPK